MDLDLAKLIVATFGAAGYGLVVFLLLVKLSSKADEHVSPEAREKFASVLLGLGQAERGSNWPDGFIATFDRVFGDRHLSLRCLGASIAASIVNLAVTSAFFLFSFPDAIRILSHNLKFYSFSVFIVFVVGNLAGDYLSLLETRYLLGRMRRMPFARFPLFVLLDAVLTCAVFAIGLEAGGLLNEIYAQNPYYPDTGFLIQAFVELLSKHTLPFQRVDVLIYFITALFTSVWIWLFVLAWVSLTGLSLARPGARFLLWLLPVREKPLASLGKVVGLAGGLAAWALADVDQVLARLEQLSAL